LKSLGFLFFIFYILFFTRLPLPRAGNLGTAALAAHAVSYNVIPILFMLPLGLSTGLCIRLGNLLGEGRVETAKMVARGTIYFGLGLACAYSVVMYVIRDRIIDMFTSDQEVAQLCQDIWMFVAARKGRSSLYLTNVGCRYLAIFLVLDGLGGTQRGILTALGLQKQQVAYGEPVGFVAE
jgi:Na+-driven multidrug efflux pump